MNLVMAGGIALPAGTMVELKLERHEFLFGCNLFTFGEHEGPEETEMRRQFADVMNYATLGFYWHVYEANRGHKLVQDRMSAANWCLWHGIQVKGHPLIWNMEPRWLSEITTQKAEQLLWARVSDEVGRFAGLIDSWDVVNEPTEGPRMARQRNATALLAAYRNYGATKVIKHAHELARRANPKATLILNDYVTSSDYERVIRRAIDEGVDFDAIGIQSHMHQGYWGLKKLWSICERFARFKMPLHFTELTVLSGRNMHGHDWESVRANWESTVAGERRQAKQVSELYHLLFSHPNVEAITWWDFSDKYAWLGAPAGLLRKDMSAKPAYYVLRDLVKKGWTTNVRVPIEAAGKLDFRGFYGTYSVTAQQAGTTLRGSFNLRKSLDLSSVTIEVQLR